MCTLMTSSKHPPFTQTSVSFSISLDFSTLREVVLVPNRMWGGEGLLGCGVGFGLLHRIPKAREEQFAPEEEAFIQSASYHQSGFDRGDSDDMQEQELFVPADDIIFDDEVERDNNPDTTAIFSEHEHPRPATLMEGPPHRIITNPFLPEHSSEDTPKIQMEPPPPPSLPEISPEEQDDEDFPSPASTPTPSSPSFHGSELTSDPPATSAPLPKPPLQPQPRRPSVPLNSLNSFRTLSPSGWGGAANRFAATPPRRATPTQFSPSIRPRATGGDHDVSDDDAMDDRGLRRSPSGSMTSIDD